MSWKKPDKIELARMKVLSDLGNTPKAIGRMIQRDGKTVSSYLRRPEIFEDPEIQTLISEYRKKEIDDLDSIIMKARQRIHELLDEGKLPAIPATAIMDRAFTQRRLLEGQPTQNLDTRSVMVHLQVTMKDLEERKKKLLAQIEQMDFRDNSVGKEEKGNGLAAAKQMRVGKDEGLE